jgi:hypothetical protein
MNETQIRESADSHGSKYEHDSLLECSAVQPQWSYHPYDGGSRHL